MPKTLVLVVIVLALSLGVASSEQRLIRVEVDPARTPALCRLMYSSELDWDPLELIEIKGGGNVTNSGWSTDHPISDRNMSVRLSELTNLRIPFEADGRPVTLPLMPDDPRMFACPLLLASDVGAMNLRAEDIAPLREYLLKGGFLWVDDFWGTYAWDNWVRQIGRVLPPHEYKIEDVPMSHSLFQTFFSVSEVPQIVDLVTQSKGLTQEVEGPDGKDVHTRAIFDKKGRMLVFMTHNTDIQNGWEREWSPTYSVYFHMGYPLGINVILYALSH